MARWRLVVHALDRTGPPMLALALARWLREHSAGDDLDVVAFRGGSLEEDVRRVAPLEVLLRPAESWDHEHPEPERVDELRQRTAGLAPADATLLVSVAAGQALDLLHPDLGGMIVTWVVEQGDDLHWLDPPVHVAAKTDRWVAGSAGTATELRARLRAANLGVEPTIQLAPEFIDLGDPPAAEIDRCRAALGGTDSPLVVGAGIGTHRKAPDLFLEVALAHRRRHGVGTRFVWLGGETDPLVPLLDAEVDRLGLAEVSFMPSVGGIDAWLAAADVFLHTARLDAFPLVCLHAAAAATPVLAFAGCGGVEEMLHDGFVGPAYPDVTAAADELHTLLGPRGAEVGGRQRARVRSLYTTATAAPVVLEHLRSAATSGSTPR